LISETVYWLTLVSAGVGGVVAVRERGRQRRGPSKQHTYEVKERKEPKIANSNFGESLV